MAHDSTFDTPTTETGCASRVSAGHGIEGCRRVHYGGTRGIRATDAHGYFASKRVGAVHPAKLQAVGVPCDNVAHLQADLLRPLDERGVPGKALAQLMAHGNVDATLNLCRRGLDDAVREAVQKVGDALFTIVHRAEAPVS